MKAISIVAALFPALAAASAANANPVRAGNSRPGDDDFKIEKAVYGYLLEKHLWDSGEYAAIFFAADDDRVAALIKKFPTCSAAQAERPGATEAEPDAD